MAGSVLIIDADEDLTRALADALRTRGVEATVTGDGKAGLDLAHINIPQAIVLCVELPRMTRDSTSTKSNTDPTLKAVPLVITSAEATPETFESHKRLKNRAEEYLKKPFAVETLLEVLTRYVGFEGSDGEVVISEDLSIEAEVPATLSDDEAFAGDDPFADVGGDLDDALDALQDQPPLLGSPFDLVGAAGLKESFDDDDDAMTTIGTIPQPKVPPPLPRNDALERKLAELEAALSTEREAHARAVRERDAALAARPAQAPTSGASQLPQSSSRELLALKRELNAKDHDILDLKDRLQSKEKDLLTYRDREMELEGRIVQAEEERDAADAARLEAEARIGSAEARALDVERSSGARITELEAQLGEAAAREAELDGALQGATSDTEALRGELEARGAELEARGAELQAKRAELDRTAADLGRTAAELDRTAADLARTTSERDQLQANLGEAQGELGQRRAELEQRKAELDAANRVKLGLQAEITRLGNELSASSAESDSLRQQLASLQDRIKTLEARAEDAEARLAQTNEDLELTRTSLGESEGRVGRALQRMRGDAEARGKARQALEIALALLQERENGIALEEEAELIEIEELRP